MDSILIVLLFLVPVVVMARVMFRSPANHEHAEPGGYAEKVFDNRFATLFVNAFRLRCPVCKEGVIFKGWFHTEERCPVCDVEIVREPGYFLGAIYFNYGLTGVLEVIIYVVCYALLGIPHYTVVGGMLIFAVLFPLYFFRYSRASWLVFDQYFAPRLPPDLEESSEA
ncbi:hypothetical protein Pan216_07100 [Planctomycetes bacterium Pan216]|uniref:DUF983 domain-containing protein n=1 Tax=Kolteria novifilia TaxID=2527975 RepID=A0A518AYS3_9BACT|nr:hypothetical protein Pan216_07100 [Planctomycetes bacterium Pan216]